MALSSDEQRLMSEFGQGRRANDVGLFLADNPHPAGSEMADAWAAGWLEEEGPTYRVAARARVDYRRPTLADIWPSAATPPAT